MSTTHGTLTLLRVSEDLSFSKGSGFQDISVIFSGKIGSVNYALHGLQYLSDLNWNSYHGRKMAAGSGVEMVEKITMVVTDR